MTLILKDINGKELPKKVQDRVNKFIDGIKTTQYLKPSKDINKSIVDKQIKLTLKCFGVKANIEYRTLATQIDRDTARATARDTARATARETARDTARDIARDIARATARDIAKDTARDTARAIARDITRDTAIDTAIATAIDTAIATARDIARDIAVATAEILVEDQPMFKSKYPNGAFIQLYKLREMGLYPVGVKDGNFIVYIPLVDGELPCDFR